MASMEVENSNHLPNEKPEDPIEYFKFKYSRDSVNEARQSLLVVAALLVQVTFQAGINPPNYIFQNRQGQQVSLTSLTIFLAANTLALSASMTIIEYLMINMPFQRELRIAMYSMGFGYGWSICKTNPTGKVQTIVLSVCSLIPPLARYLPRKWNKRGTVSH